jgi:AraC-like DNA-binding protein
MSIAENVARIRAQMEEAAIACGFRDYSTFYRVCCKHFGSAPSDLAAGVAPEKVLLRRG